jgi:hypothetical protein
MPTAETINGFSIIKQSPTPKAPMTRAGRVILVDRGEEYEPERYVTAWQGQNEKNKAKWDSCWTYGHYHDNLTEASQDFDKRVARGY